MLIVNPSAAYDWRLIREEIADSALRKLRKLGAGENAAPEDRVLALNALDSVLKNLAWRGYDWPKTLSGSASLSFGANAISQALPADFYNPIAFNYLDTSGNEVPLKPMTTKEYDSITVKTTAGIPSQYYIDNFNVIFLWPVNTVAQTIKAYYRKIILDTVAQGAVDLDSPWMLGLPYGVACELVDDFVIMDNALISRIETKWREQVKLGVQHESQAYPLQMTVND